MELHKYTLIFNRLVREKYFNVFNDELVFIKNDDQFYYQELLGHTIAVKDKLEKNLENDLLHDRFRKYIKDDFFWCCPFLDEIFSFLHEVGHCYDTIVNGTIDYRQYKECYSKVYSSHYSGAKAYAELPAEKFADTFAADFINDNIVDIWNIIDGTPKEDIKEFLML